MEEVNSLIGLLSDRLRKVAAANAVVAKPVSMGDRHIVTLCELSLSFAGGGGTGEGGAKDGPSGSGMGAIAGGGAKANPVAVLVVEGTDVRLEMIGR